MVIYATARLVEALCENMEFDIPIYDFRGRSFSLFNQQPSPIPELARNMFKHQAPGDYRLWLMWKEIHPDDLIDQSEPAPKSEWVIIDVEKTPQQVVTDVYWDGTCIMKDTVMAAMEICGEPNSGIVICGEECPEPA